MNLKKLILQGESETLEFKTSTGEWKEIIETISAFANTRGGKITIGVSKTGKPVGVEIGCREKIDKCGHLIVWRKSSKILFANSSKSN